MASTPLSHRERWWSDEEWGMKDEGWGARCEIRDARCEIGKPEDGLWVTKLWKWCGMLR